MGGDVQADERPARDGARGFASTDELGRVASTLECYTRRHEFGRTAPDR